MPVTPLHLGPALVLKSATRRHFSIPTFAFTQVVIDGEVLVGMAFVGDLSFHGIMHTLLSATAVTILTVVLYGSVIRRLSRLWNYVADARVGTIPYMEPDVPLWMVALSAAVGSYSHVLLDAAGNPDIAPFAPLTMANPFSGRVLPEEVVMFCIVTWVIGGCCLLGLSYFRRRGAERGRPDAAD